ncbi:MAG: radical SAM protein [Lachnospiraceae bacterium]|nr:radical SAM protein [Lachnospiraceae bacterium]
MSKLSAYNYFVNDKDRTIVFNTFSGSIIRVNKEKKDLLLSDINAFDDGEIEDLKRLGIVIDDEVDEKKIIEFDRARGVYGHDTVTFRVLVTTRCNARCVYCFEGTDGIDDMSYQTANAVIDFIQKMSANANKINVQWFGGEPSLNIKIIEYITEKLKNKYDYSGKELAFSMITNGSLADFDVKKLGVERVQISLDGCDEIYRHYKQYRDPTIDLDRVLNNINKYISQGIFVSLRLNYDKDNYDSIIELISLLGNRIISKKFVNVYPYPLFGTYLGHRNCQDGTTPEQLLNIYKALLEQELISQNMVFGFDYQKHRCFACNANSFVIDVDGKLYKCCEAKEKGNNYFGNVFSNFEVSEEYLKWVNIDLSSECEACVFLPLCQGGCKAADLTNHPVKCFLKKDIIDDLLRIYIERNK